MKKIITFLTTLAILMGGTVPTSLANNVDKKNQSFRAQLIETDTLSATSSTYELFLRSQEMVGLPLNLASGFHTIFAHFASLEGSSSPDADDLPLSEPEEYRAMWISYLELSDRDLTTRGNFVSEITTMFSQCKELGLNRVIVQVRPFGDALYPSEIFPWSHLLSGVQGVDPGYDPLQEMITIAHGMDLNIEAWLNPYRVKLNSTIPAYLSPNNPANNTNLTFSVDNALYYNPALPEVQQLVVDGVAELVRNYDLDGIHLDDYFYPTTDLSVDARDYAISGSTLSQADWRRENVNTLVKTIYETVKSIDETVLFGISPQGNNDNNYNSQYSDVKLWLSTKGYVDYITPQLYWGFQYYTTAGRADFQYLTIANTWHSYPRHPDVDLYVGLAAYRIGAGDGSSSTTSEWNSGQNLANMIVALDDFDGITGYTLFRHDFLFNNSSYSYLAQWERQSIMALYGLL